MKQGNAPIRVDLIGTSQRTRDTLSMVFNGPTKGICEFSDGGSADAVIIDLDGIGAHALWGEYRSKNPGCPAIVLSVKRGNISNADEILIKPIKIQELCDAMKRVADGVSRRQSGKSGTDHDSVPADGVAAAPTASMPAENEPSTQTVPVLAQNLEQTITKNVKPSPSLPGDFKEVCGDAEDIDIEKPDQVTRILMPLNNRLLGVVLYAISESEHQQVPIAVRLKHKHLFVLFPGQQAASFTIKDGILQRLCARIFPAGAFGFKAVPDLMPDTDDPLTISKEQMLWKMAAWTYCGKLPQDTQLQERVYLRHWPNLPRLLKLPDAMRISALLVDQPMLLVRAAEALDIPQRHVFAFYGAAQAIGLMERAKRNSDYLLEAPATPPENTDRKLLGRMMVHLRKLLS